MPSARHFVGANPMSIDRADVSRPRREPREHDALERLAESRGEHDAPEVEPVEQVAKKDSKPTKDEPVKKFTNEDKKPQKNSVA